MKTQPATLFALLAMAAAAPGLHAQPDPSNVARPHGTDNPSASHNRTRLPPAPSHGFRTPPAGAVPGQALVPPPQHAKGGVITPPTAVDKGITSPTPPAAAFPTPVIKPAQPPG